MFPRRSNASKNARLLSPVGETGSASFGIVVDLYLFAIDDVDLFDSLSSLFSSQFRYRASTTGIGTVSCISR